MTDEGVETQSSEDSYEPPAVFDLGRVFTVTNGGGGPNTDRTAQGQD